MDFAVLGPLLVRRDGETIQIGALKQRALLIHLLLRAGQTVSVERLIDALWGEDPPPQARVTLRSYVSNLRRVLETADERIIVTRGNGYGVQVPSENIDAVRFARLAERAHAGATQDPAAALTLLDEALALWRGDALADLADGGWASGERTRLEELRLSAVEDRFEVLLALGRHAEAAAGLEAFTAEVPIRERAQGLLMTALYRSGRAADALAVFKRFRETLVDELGLEPTAQLQELAERILRQEEAPGPAAAPVVAPPAAAGAQPDSSPEADPAEGLIGRTHERAELQQAVRRLLAGTGGLVLITGEPGIGKSTMLEQLAAMSGAGGARVLWGRCQETKGAPPFWPWIQVLRDIAATVDDAELRRLAGGAAAAVSHLVDTLPSRLDTLPPPLAEEIEAARFQLYDAVAAFLLRSADQRPVVVLLDDLHWADVPTLETLAFLAPLLGSGRLLVAATYRESRGDWANDLEATLATVLREPLTQQVGLVGLQPDAVADLAERLTGQPLSATERELLHARTRGNPFFVRQLSQLLPDSEQRDEAGRPLPSAVTHVIGRRLRLLPPAARSLLEAACVVGGRFDVRWLADATGLDPDEMLDAADTAAGFGLVEPVGRSASTYQFVHALVRETIYGGLTPVRAARTHADVAQALEQVPHTPASVLAEHFWHASDVLSDDRPVRYLLAAADDALRVFGHEQAEAYLRKALELAVEQGAEPAVELQVRVRLVQLVVSTRGWTAVDLEEIAEPARRLARGAGARAEILPLWTALFIQYMSRGETTIATEMVEQLLVDADQQRDPAAMAAARISACQLDLSRGRNMERVLTFARQAVEYAETAATHGEATEVLPASYMLTCALAFTGQTEAAKHEALRSIAIAEASGDRYSLALTHMIVGWVAMIMGEVALAAQYADAAVALAEDHGFKHVRLTAIVVQGWAGAQLGGDAATAAARMLEAVEALSRSGHKAEQARRLLYTAVTFELAGDLAAAKRCVDEARTVARMTGECFPPSEFQRLPGEHQPARTGLSSARRG